MQAGGHIIDPVATSNGIQAECCEALPPFKEVAQALAAQERRALARPSYQPLEMAETPMTATRAPIHANGAGRAP